MPVSNDPAASRKALFETKFKHDMLKYQQFEKLYEMDVAYTIQKDLEEENDHAKQQQAEKE